jgi:uncharacterized membrane protein
MELRKAILASAVAGLFVAGGAVAANAESHEGGAEAEKIHCEGVNACKGHSDCSTATNDCKGLNECKGKGYVSMTQEECDAAKAAAAE